MDREKFLKSLRPTARVLVERQGAANQVTVIHEVVRTTTGEDAFYTRCGLRFNGNGEYPGCVHRSRLMPLTEENAMEVIRETLRYTYPSHVLNDKQLKIIMHIILDF